MCRHAHSFCDNSSLVYLLLLYCATAIEGIKSFGVPSFSWQYGISQLLATQVYSFYLYVSLTWLCMEYSEILFCNYLHIVVNIIHHSLNSTEELDSSIWIAEHMGAYLLLIFTASDGVMVMSPNTF